MPAICVYCSSQNVARTHFDATEETGALIARRGWSLVYGGGDHGLMGAVARSVLDAGGHVTGVIPDFMTGREGRLATRAGSVEIVSVPDMRARKAQMEIRSDAFLVLPGGFGTMDELFEMLTFRLLSLHPKPVVILNHEGFYTHLIALAGQFFDQGFARREPAILFHVANTPAEAIHILATEFSSANPSHEG